LGKILIIKEETEVGMDGERIDEKSIEEVSLEVLFT
jgi:hypothetical protein